MLAKLYIKLVRCAMSTYIGAVASGELFILTYFHTPVSKPLLKNTPAASRARATAGVSAGTGEACLEIRSDVRDQRKDADAGGQGTAMLVKGLVAVFGAATGPDVVAEVAML